MNVHQTSTQDAADMSGTPDTAPDTPKRVFVVDDDEGMRVLMKTLIEMDERYRFCGAATTATDLRQQLSSEPNKRENIDLVITDLTLPDMSGIELAQELRRDLPAVKFVLYTGWQDPETLKKAHAAGVDHVFTKDQDPQQILDDLARDPR